MATAPAPAPTPTPTPTPVATPPPAADQTSNAAPFAQPFARIVDLPDCNEVPQPLVQLRTISMYAANDATYSQIDPARKAERDKMLEPIRKLTSGVSHYANRYVQSGGADTNSGGCALAWLDAWARADAMTRMQDAESQFVRSVNLAGWAMAYSQVRNLEVTRNAPHAAIEAWLRRMADDLRGHMNAITNKTARNNHRYWAGLAATAVALGTDDAGLADWGVESARIGLRQVAPDGTLPLELERAKLAAHYHIYAAAPLVMTAAIARMNGIDLYAENDGALHRLVRFATDTITSPEQIRALTGVDQQPIDLDSSVGQQQIAWFEYYIRWFPDRVPAQNRILARRSLRNNEIGGDMTLLNQSAR